MKNDYINKLIDKLIDDTKNALLYWNYNEKKILFDSVFEEGECFISNIIDNKDLTVQIEIYRINENRYTMFIHSLDIINNSGYYKKYYGDEIDLNTLWNTIIMYECINRYSKSDVMINKYINMYLNNK